MAVVHLKIPAQLYQRYSHLAYSRALEPAHFMCQVLADHLARRPSCAIRGQGSRSRPLTTPMTRFTLSTTMFECYADMAYQYGVTPNDLILNVLNQQLTQQISTLSSACDHRTCAVRCQSQGKSERRMGEVACLL
ncbi:hypothetical protein [Thioflexithrix psekupsensis]|uniref:Uncharacterized protein n=1 Tax=Thioflexithrix psekupsensis TaxID=1570016 RepID=A0A251XD22_9GAMM|nr:hypothetical protein [Thioflexithrix psekupsensis]OUD16034.1 hypothetical protein TPSD3_01120 [Thioflexithrix psekupsensis]